MTTIPTQEELIRDEYLDREKITEHAKFLIEKKGVDPEDVVQFIEDNKDLYKWKPKAESRPGYLSLRTYKKVPSALGEMFSRKSEMPLGERYGRATMRSIGQSVMGKLTAGLTPAHLQDPYSAPLIEMIVSRNLEADLATRRKMALDGLKEMGEKLDEMPPETLAEKMVEQAGGITGVLPDFEVASVIAAPLSGLPLLSKFPAILRMAQSGAMFSLVEAQYGPEEAAKGFLTGVVFSFGGLVPSRAGRVAVDFWLGKGLGEISGAGHDEATAQGLLFATLALVHGGKEKEAEKLLRQHEMKEKQIERTMESIRQAFEEAKKPEHAFKPKEYKIHRMPPERKTILHGPPEGYPIAEKAKQTQEAVKPERNLDALKESFGAMEEGDLKAQLGDLKALEQRGGRLAGHFGPIRELVEAELSRRRREVGEGLERRLEARKQPAIQAREQRKRDLADLRQNLKIAEDALQEAKARKTWGNQTEIAMWEGMAKSLREKLEAAEKEPIKFPGPTGLIETIVAEKGKTEAKPKAQGEIRFQTQQHIDITPPGKKSTNPFPEGTPEFDRYEAAMRKQEKRKADLKRFPPRELKDWKDANRILDEIIQKPADLGLEDIERIEDFIGNNRNSIPPQELDLIEERLGPHKAALEKEVRLKQIAEENGRQFFEVEGWLANDYGDKGWGHVAPGDVLVKVVLQGNGKLDPAFNVDQVGIFVNRGPGQAARIRIQHKAGMAPLIFDEAKLAERGIKVKGGAEGIIDVELPLDALTEPAKLRALDVILNELDYQGRSVTPEIVKKIANALGISEKIVGEKLRPRPTKPNGPKRLSLEEKAKIEAAVLKEQAQRIKKPETIIEQFDKALKEGDIDKAQLIFLETKDRVNKDPENIDLTAAEDHMVQKMKGPRPAPKEPPPQPPQEKPELKIVRPSEPETPRKLTPEETLAQKNQEPADSMRFLEGRGHTAYDGLGGKWDFREAVVEFEDLNFDTSQYQPRDMDAVASEAFLQKFQRELRPEELTLTQNVQDGIPIVDETGQLIGGFHRLTGIGRTIQNFPENYEKYRKYLEDSGIDTTGMSQPVLVRIPEPGQDRLKLSQITNRKGQQSYSAVEQAHIDAKKMSWDVLSGIETGGKNLREILLAPRNRPLVRELVQILAEGDIGPYITKDGGLSSQGLELITNAFTAKIYGGRLATEFIENPKGVESLKNLKTALENITADAAKVKGLIEAGALPKEIDITDDLAMVVNQLALFRSEKDKWKGPQAFIDQPDLLGGGMTQFQKQMFLHINERIRKVNDITKVLKAYFYETSLVPPPNQGDLLGGIPRTKEQMWHRAVEMAEGQSELFGETAAGGFFDMGGYAKMPTIIELPELVELAEGLSKGKYPKVMKRLRKQNALGVFYPRTGEIKLVADLFRDTDAAVKTLAHEIGHMADWLPDKEMGRGNILGRIASLTKYLKNELEGVIGTNKEIREQLKDVSMLWKPFDRERDQGYTKYRDSSKELYADAISVLFNNPDLLKTRAHLFYRAFFDHLNRKPEVERMYSEIMERTKSGRIHEERQRRLEDMFKKGEELYHKQQQLEDEAAIGAWRWFRRSVFDANEAAGFWLREAKKNGAVVDSETNPIPFIEDRIYQANHHQLYMKEIGRLFKEMQKHGIQENDLHAFMTLQRIEHERVDIANPLGFTMENAKEQKQLFRAKLGERKWSVLADIADRFGRYRIDEIMPMLRKSEMFDDNLMHYMENNKWYVTFNVAEKWAESHFGKWATAKVYRQFGTLKPVMPPLTETVMKDTSLLYAAYDTIAKKKVVKLFEKHLPGYVMDAKTEWNGKTHVPLEPKDPRLGLIMYQHKGKLVGKWVPHDVADMVNYKPDASDAVVKALQWANIVPRAMFTELNPGFWPFAIIKDYWDWQLKLPGVNPITGSFKGMFYFLKATKPVLLDKMGIDVELINEMERRNMFLPKSSYRGAMGLTESQLEAQLRLFDRQFGRKKNPVRDTLALAMEAWRTPMDVLERIPKVAGEMYLEANKEKLGLSDKEIEHLVRHRAGSPAFLIGGRGKPFYNNVVLFFNPFIQGWRATAAEAKEEPGNFAAHVAVNAILPRAIMYLMAIGVMGTGAKKMMDDVSEYDKSNYLILPLGRTENGKTVILRIPQSENLRTMGGIFWKMLTARKAKDISDLADYMADQVPTLSTVISMPLEIGIYAAGKNPYDYFRGKYVINERIFEAGGMRKHKQFIKYLWNRAGGNVIYKFDTDNVDEIKGTLEKTLNLPLVGNTLGRFIKVTNYGTYERIRERQREASGKRTDKALQLRERIADFVLINEGGDIVGEHIARLYRDLVQEGLAVDAAGKPIALPAFVKRVREAAEKRHDNAYMNAIIYATSIDDQLIALQVAKEDLSPPEFEALRIEAIQGGYLTEEAQKRFLIEQYKANQGTGAGRQ